MKVYKVKEIIKMLEAAGWYLITVKVTIDSLSIRT